MQDYSDAELLGQYARNGAEAAFAEIVTRHAPLVYSTALRQVHSPETARDVSQSVFLDLSRKARRVADKLGCEASLIGWLYRSTCFAASTTMRGDLRRQTRERRAMEQLESLTAVNESSPEWEDLQPLLDNAMTRLREKDRVALLLRFFEGQDLHGVGLALGISDDGAQKRVARALEKLRKILAGKGLTTTSAALCATISANAVQTLPSDVLNSISKIASLAGTAIKGSTTFTGTKIISMTTIQKAAAVTVLSIVAGAAIYEALRNSRLHEQVQMFQQRQTSMSEELINAKSENAILSKQVQAGRSSSANPEQRLRELLRLRGEVGALRRRQRELEQALASVPPQALSPAIQSRLAGPNLPAPFRVHLVSDSPSENTEPIVNKTGQNVAETLQIQKTPIMDYTAIRSASVALNSASGRPEIDVEFSEEGKDLLAAITKENINRRLAIVLDGKVFSAPMIRSEIPGGKVQITGDFTEEEATMLATKINDAVRSQ